jgi:hypothetical protein
MEHEAFACKALLKQSRAWLAGFFVLLICDGWEGPHRRHKAHPWSLFACKHAKRSALTHRSHGSTRINVLSSLLSVFPWYLNYGPPRLRKNNGGSSNITRQ